MGGDDARALPGQRRGCCPMGTRTRPIDASPARSRGAGSRSPIDCSSRPQENTMLIALLDLHTTPADRTTALAQLDAERDEIRAMPGNLDFRVLAARDDDGG